MTRPAAGSERRAPAGQARAVPAGPLIGAAELAVLASSAEAPVIFDVRWRLAGPAGIESYLAGHLPGAVFADLDADLAGPPGRAGRHPLPDPGVFQAAMRAAGLGAGRLAVAYDEADGTTAARLWWLLRYHGHDQVRVLDGGIRAWTWAGQPVVTGLPDPVPGDFTAVPGHMPVLDAAGAAVLARDGVLLDARSPERYKGETEPVDPVAGHIPGAVSAAAAGNVAADGKFLDPAELRARFASLGAGPAPVGAYCGSGVTAAQQVLALELAGWPGAALYVGSWSEWVADPARPVATGPAANLP